MKNKDIIIDKEFNNLIPPLSTEEYNGLKESILKEGCRDPLVLWDNILLDGHNRYHICMENNVIFKRVEKNFESRDLAKVWILENQLGRRNLNDAQRIDLVDKLYGLQERLAAKKRKDKISKLPPQTRGNISTSLDGGKSRDVLGKKAKVSGRTYDKGIKIKKKNPALWKECLDDNVSIDAAYKELNRKNKEQELQQKAIKGNNLKITNKDIDFRHGDFKDVLKNISNSSIDLIITDPPYDYESINLWSDLSSFASRVLKPNKFCIAYSGTVFFPEVIQRLGEHLEYYWIFALIYPNARNCRVMGRSIFQYWKPILVYQNGFKKNKDFCSDIIHGSGREKDNHKWQQSCDELKTIIEFFTKENDVILDPMAGTGTTAISALKLHRKFLGCEIDEQTYNIAKARINEEIKNE